LERIDFQAMSVSLSMLDGLNSIRIAIGFEVMGTIDIPACHVVECDS
tara:strand:- start:54618 stop:54758 length:141 start_codon:yes stop_codon:yes gene_type:complete